MRMLRVTYRGFTYKIHPNAVQALIGASAAYNDGSIVTGAKALLGERQYAIFRARHSTLGELDELVTMIRALQRTRNR
jgi:hypothetical protein